MFSVLKKVYQSTIGKKTIAGGLLVIIGSAIGGPLGAGCGKVGELVLVAGLGDKAARYLTGKVKEKKHVQTDAQGQH